VTEPSDKAELDLAFARGVRDIARTPIIYFPPRTPVDLKAAYDRGWYGRVLPTDIEAKRQAKLLKDEQEFNRSK
jgi:hypothetical protein